MNFQMDSLFEKGAEFSHILLVSVLHFRVTFMVLDNIDTGEINSHKSPCLNS